MNGAHLHLLVNHLSLISIPVVLVFLAFGLKFKNQSLIKFALAICVLASLAVVPAFLSGEPAEEVVEHLPGIQESAIEAHEDAAKFALVLCLVNGALALFGLASHKSPERQIKVAKALFVTGALSVLSLARVSNLGGEIMHRELSGGSQSQLVEPTHSD